MKGSKVYCEMKFSRFGWVSAFVLIRLAIEVVGDPSSFYMEFSSSPKKAVAVIRQIHVFGESNYMKTKIIIHEDRSHFDLYVQLIHELGSNHLIMNIKVRVKPEGSNVFVQLFEMRRVNFCEFLNEYNSNPMMQMVFKKNLNWQDIIVCPVRVGNYSLLNSGIAENIQPDGVQNGTYRFFAEIVEEIGEIAKVFALQVTSVVYIVDKELDCKFRGKALQCLSNDA
ncbi:uncharacterized protein LOC6536473 [Drosophila yakuba]|uniref:Uncharacterized protein n=1 Tax=Drosophila yakuba TaxID=7245 RepID=B4PKK7_DROYA|nr:uncharacterized protein LOC6536473 [Drosophila yakuba]EDW96766.2 uncharacterized protein Dyak_GE26008 [Drosophila yakuba]